LANTPSIAYRAPFCESRKSSVVQQSPSKALNDGQGCRRVNRDDGASLFLCCLMRRRAGLPSSCCACRLLPMRRCERVEWCGRERDLKRALSLSSYCFSALQSFSRLQVDLSLLRSAPLSYNRVASRPPRREQGQPNQPTQSRQRSHAGRRGS
jgi:hypothetical protein